MSRRLGHASEINASPQWVWEVLTDLPAYPQWNQFLLRAEGRVELGSILIVLMQPVGAGVPSPCGPPWSRPPRAAGCDGRADSACPEL
jgi:hypothetical protein